MPERRAGSPRSPPASGGSSPPGPRGGSCRGRGRPGRWSSSYSSGTPKLTWSRTNRRSSKASGALRRRAAGGASRCGRAARSSAACRRAGRVRRPRPANAGVVGSRTSPWPIGDQARLERGGVLGAVRRRGRPSGPAVTPFSASRRIDLGLVDAVEPRRRERDRARDVAAARLAAAGASRCRRRSGGGRRSSGPGPRPGP